MAHTVEIYSDLSLVRKVFRNTEIVPKVGDMMRVEVHVHRANDMIGSTKFNARIAEVQLTALPALDHEFGYAVILDQYEINEFMDRLDKGKSKSCAVWKHEEPLTRNKKVS